MVPCDSHLNGLQNEKLLVLAELHQLQDPCEEQGQGPRGQLTQLEPPLPKKTPTKNLKTTPKNQEGVGMDEGVGFFQPEICLVLVPVQQLRGVSKSDPYPISCVLSAEIFGIIFFKIFLF